MNNKHEGNQKEYEGLIIHADIKYQNFALNFG
jgi:hypothetical protein